MAQFDIEGRIAQLRTRMRKESVDAFLALRSLNVQYLTGFDNIADASDPHAVLVTMDALRFMTDARYLEVAQRQAQQSAQQSTQQPTSNSFWKVDDAQGKTLEESFVKTWNLASFDTIALEDTVSHRRFTIIIAAVSGSTKIAPAKKWVEDIRRTKDALELERIAAAASIGDKAFPLICEYIKPGLSEREVALELEFTLRHLGGDALAFPCIVASGKAGSFPHAVPGDRQIQAGDLVTLDFGVNYKGYCSDMTRTVFVGGGGAQPSDRQRLVYETVRTAQEAGLAAIRAERSGKEIDAVARAVIEEAGFGEYFLHGLGHGVGMHVHELPGVSKHSSAALPEHSVVTCEPGIYIAGELGVRIEDLVVVEKDGCRNLSTSPKELLIV